MKFQLLSLTVCCALASCSGSDDTPTPLEQPVPSAAMTPEPIKRTAVTVRANKAIQKIALDRLEIKKQITAVLKPLRDPAAALAKETELKQLFGEYNRLAQVAAEAGIKGRPLAELTAHLAPDEWSDVYTQFTQYELLVKQLGEPQREMMKRVMEEGSPAAAANSSGLQNHLEQLQTPIPGNPAKQRPGQSEPPTE